MLILQATPLLVYLQQRRQLTRRHHLYLGSCSHLLRLGRCGHAKVLTLRAIRQNVASVLERSWVSDALSVLLLFHAT